MEPKKTYTLKEKEEILQRIDALGPLNLRQVSHTLQISISTLSRILKEKKHKSSIRRCRALVGEERGSSLRHEDIEAKSVFMAYELGSQKSTITLRKRAEILQAIESQGVNNLCEMSKKLKVSVSSLSRIINDKRHINMAFRGIHNPQRKKAVCETTPTIEHTYAHTQNSVREKSSSDPDRIRNSCINDKSDGKLSLYEDHGAISMENKDIVEDHGATSMENKDIVEDHGAIPTENKDIVEDHGAKSTENNKENISVGKCKASEITELPTDANCSMTKSPTNLESRDTINSPIIKDFPVIKSKLAECKFGHTKPTSIENRVINEESGGITINTIVKKIRNPLHKFPHSETLMKLQHSNIKETNNDTYNTKRSIEDKSHLTSSTPKDYKANKTIRNKITQEYQNKQSLPPPKKSTNTPQEDTDINPTLSRSLSKNKLLEPLMLFRQAAESGKTPVWYTLAVDSVLHKESKIIYTTKDTSDPPKTSANCTRQELLEALWTLQKALRTKEGPPLWLCYALASLFRDCEPACESGSS